MPGLRSWLCLLALVFAFPAFAGSKIVLFVHGVNGDAEATWKTVLDRGSVKPQVVSADTLSGLARNDFYSMDLSEPKSRFELPVAPGLIERQAGELGAAVEAIRRVPGNEGREIVLVCHSRGGMVAREYLSRTPSPPISDTVFIGVPHLLMARVRGNQPLPKSVRYYSLLNPDDHVVNLSQQVALFDQQPDLRHQQLKTTGWSGRVGHQIGAGPADQLWAAVDAIAANQAGAFTDYGGTRKGVDFYAWGRQVVPAVAAAGAGVLLGRAFGPLGMVIGGTAGMMLGGGLSTGARWAVGESLIPRGNLQLEQPAAPTSSPADALKRWKSAVAALASATAKGAKDQLRKLHEEVQAAKAALDRSR